LQAGYGVKRAKINLLQSQGQELVAKNNLNKIIYQAVEDARGAEAKYHSAQSVMAAQKDAFFAIEQRYHVGLANAVEFNTALTNRNKAELDWIQSKYEALLKIKIIDFYLGKDINF
jgi:outer membrane protein